MAPRKPGLHSTDPGDLLWDPLAQSNANEEIDPVDSDDRSIRENPRVVLQAVRKARQRNPGSLANIEPYEWNRAPPGFGSRLPALKPRGPRRR